MKGPAARWKHDVRRIWECPVCQRRERTDGDVVNRSCDCQLKSEPSRPTWMLLLEEQPKRPQGPPEAPAEPPSVVGLEQPLGDAGPSE
jgi:hypothetical protein